MPSSDEPDFEPTPEIDIFRSFNRFYTKYIGTLKEGLLNSEFSLTEARVLYELSSRSAPRASEIADELALDNGYLSRVLTKFERDGLLERKTSEQDGRYAELKLTLCGKSAFKKLDILSNEQAQAALRHLPEQKKMELLRSMESIEKILLNSPPNRSPYILRPHRVGDMGWVVYRESLGYAEQYGWDERFEALVAKIVADFLTNFDLSRERCWMAELNGQNVGHVFLVKHPDQPQTAKLRLLFVEPVARGMGLGESLVRECVAFARGAGYRKIVLWTQSILTAAHHIYEKAGFQLLREEPHNSFGQNLIGQEWELHIS